MVEQVARRQVDEGPSASDAESEARRVHKIIRWMLLVLREIIDFDELARFVPEYVNTEAKKANKFQQGLKTWIRSQVDLLDIRTYAALVHKAMIVEGEREATKRESEGNKRKFEESEQDQGSSKFRGMFGTNVGNQYQKFQRFKPRNGIQINCFQKAGQSTKESRPQIQECKTCGKRIAGPPPPPPQIVQPRARTFITIMKDVVHDVDVVAGTLAINLVEVKVLMDSGATRSFISENVVDRMKYDVYPLESNLIIEVANQERVISDRIFPNCDIVIKGRYFSADLIPFKLGDFVVILGMDWLANHDAQIECRNKKVKLRTKDGAEVILKGKRGDKKFLMAIQTMRLLRQGCEAYLANVKNVEKELLKIKGIHVVKEFPDVFPDELPGLPPDREIEFMIDLAPGTEPVSKAPYRMSPIIMKELATQLQKLLDKGVIRPNVSP
ncbi:uncharacterized protein LOC141690872 [Apium graveolens]|uniref:uncharacterized protein LOC141690872 n=1 Tax=Apium graveolens TaxID=4045 RepID=UPI003D7A478A